MKVISYNDWVRLNSYETDLSGKYCPPTINTFLGIISFNVRLLTHPLTHKIGHLEHDPNDWMVVVQLILDVLWYHFRIWIGPNSTLTQLICKVIINHHFYKHIFRLSLIEFWDSIKWLRGTLSDTEHIFN